MPCHPYAGRGPGKPRKRVDSRSRGNDMGEPLPRLHCVRGSKRQPVFGFDAGEKSDYNHARSGW
jgi:hypothetical protein